MVPSKKTAPPALKYTPEQCERAFRLAERAWSGPFVEAMLNEPKAMRNLAKRCLEFVAIFDEAAS